MATPNNVTPTNCSWWPISALENDAGKGKDGEENQDPTDPALKAQDRLVLYHWTQSFSSQKVKCSAGFSGRITSSIQGLPLPREEGAQGRASSNFPTLARGAVCAGSALLYPHFCVSTASPWGRDVGGGAQPNPAVALRPGFAAGDASALCSLPTLSGVAGRADKG